MTSRYEMISKTEGEILLETMIIPKKGYDTGVWLGSLFLILLNFLQIYTLKNLLCLLVIVKLAIMSACGKRTQKIWEQSKFWEEENKS